MSEDQIFEHPLGELPDDDILRVVLTAGEVKYGSSSVEPLWVFTLYAIIDRKFRLSNSVSLKAGAGLFQHLPINSVWRGQHNVGFLEDEWPFILQCDLTSQEVVFREADNILGLPQYSYEASATSYPCIKFNLLGEPQTNFAIVRAFEVGRYYYGYLPMTSRYVFSFNKHGHNKALFNEAKTRRLNGSTFQIDPSAGMTLEEQARICVYLNSEIARKALYHAGSSARGQYKNGEPIRPVFRIPVGGITPWRVAGRPSQISLTNKSGETQLVQAFGISRIQECAHVSDIKKVITLQRVKRKPKPEKKRGLEIPITKPRQTARKLPVRSDIDPGTQTMPPQDNLKPLRCSRAAWESLTLVREITSDDDATTMKQITEQEEIDLLSSRSGSGGETSVGTFNDIPDIRQRIKYEDVDIDPDEGRDESVHIFDEVPEGKLGKAHMNPTFLPDNFRYLFDGFLGYLNQYPESDAYFRGGNNVFYPDKVPYYLMEANWGSAAKYSKSPQGVLRGIVIQIRTREGYMYYFDLEPRAGQSISIHCMLTNGDVPLSEDKIKTIFYLRLFGEKRGWPSRSQYAGEFWTEAMYHYDAEHGGSCSENLAIHHSRLLDLRKQTAAEQPS